MVLPAVLFSFALIYLGFPTWDYYFDGLTFAMAVEGVAAGGDPGWLLHPHHLLYSPLAFLAYETAWALGLKIRAWLLMQWLSTLCAASGLYLFYRLQRRTGIGAGAALAGIVLLGSSYSYWRFGTQGDTTMPTALLLLVVLSLAISYPGSRPMVSAAVRLGLVQGAAILLHETAMLFIPAVAWAIWRSRRGRHRDWRPRVRAIAAFLAAVAAVAGTAYLAATVLVLGIRSPAGFAGWLSGYFAADPRTGYAAAYGGWAGSNISASARAWIDAWFGTFSVESLPLTVAAALIAMAMLGHLPFRTIGAILAKPFRDPDRRRLTIEILLVWLVIHAVFFTWWKPGHTRFWLLALPGWTLLIQTGLAVSGFGGRQAALAAGERRAAPAPLAMLAAGAGASWLLAVLVAAVVGLGAFRRESDPACNKFLPLSQALAERTQENAVVIISGVGPYTALKAYVPYFARRNMLILDWQFADRSVSPARALDALRARIGRTEARVPVYLLSEVLDPGLDAHFMSVHGIAGESRRRLFAGFRRVSEISPGLFLLASGKP